MRNRLAIILFVPSLLLLLALGVAYARSAAEAEQQAAYVDRLRDVGYLTVAARESLLADDPDLVAADLERYQDVYGVDAAVLDSSGTTWASNGLDPSTVPARLEALSGRRGEFDPAVLPWQVDRVVIAEPVFDGGDLVGAVVTVSEVEHVSQDVWRNWAMLAVIAVLLAVLALPIAGRTAAWVLRPVRRVDRAMSRIGAGEWGARIPDSIGPPELRAITSRFNDMAEQVQSLVLKQRQFVHNASHELRNPLTALTLRVEALELTTPEDRVPEVAAVRAEAVRLRHILDALLLLADGDTGAAETERVDLAALVEERVRSWGTLAPDRELALEIDPGSPTVDANVTAVECALDAVIDNALKFSPADRPVAVTVHTGPDQVSVVVRDHGTGLPADQLGSATERFWRGPQHRDVRGSGLGLAIASELLGAGGGRVRLRAPDDGGLEVILTIPSGRGRD